MLTTPRAPRARRGAASAPTPFAAGVIWRYEHVKANIWTLTLRTPIAATGVSVQSTYAIPYLHRMIETRFRHTDAANAPSTAPMDLLWEYLEGQFPSTEYHIDASPTTDTFIDYSSGSRIINPTTYRLTQNTLATTLIHVTIKLELI